MKYDASSGTASGTATSNGGAPLKHLHFDVESAVIPAFHLPFTYGVLRIDITPKILQGRMNIESKEINLTYEATFQLNLPSTPPLVVRTDLTTESCAHDLQGSRIDEKGDALLVGTAVVPKTSHAWTNALLQLPTVARAYMPCRFEVT